MPKVPDGRVGVYNTVGWLSRDWVLVNTCKQCQMWQAGGCAHCYTHWEGIFGCSRVRYTYLGCFGDPGGAEASAKSLENISTLLILILIMAFYHKLYF